MYEEQGVENFFEQWPDPIIAISRDGLIVAANSPARIYDPKLSSCHKPLNICDICDLSQEALTELAEVKLKKTPMTNISLTFRHYRKDNSGTVKMQAWNFTLPNRREVMILRAVGYMNLMQKFSLLGDAIDKLNDEIKRRREIEIKLRFALEEAQAAMRLKDQFLRQISHEFRTPLNAIIGMSEIMQAQVLGSMPEPYAGYVKDINYCGRTLLELIEEILNYREGVGYEETVTDLNECLSNCLNIVSSLAAGKGLNLVVVGADRLPVVKANQILLKRIFINLISNAIKYTPSGGTIEIHPEVNGGVVSVLITDTGIGIKQQDLAHIFEPFFRAEDVYVRNADGLGMGLALTKRAVEQIGARINISSDFGHGTQVKVVIPNPVFC